ncbi:MAG: hypothetical protein IJI10_05020 [Eubacterium sp.]|nr:hypothetical protein [Eubacterium sp.]
MKRSAWMAFLIAEALLYGSFLLLDLLTDADTKWLKYASILLAAIISLHLDDKIISAALCFAAAGDIFLLVLDQWYGIGILLFFIVQLMYSLHLHARKILCIQSILIFSAVLLALVVRRIELLAAGYILIFLLNLICGTFRAAKERTGPSILFFLGMLLFFCCDLCVGYYNIGTGALRAFARVAMWGFYLPGQMLILLSASNKGDLK